MIGKEYLGLKLTLDLLMILKKLGDQQDDECIECYYEADLRKDLEVHDTTMVTMQKEILSSWVVAKVLNVRIVILNQMLKAI